MSFFLRISSAPLRLKKAYTNTYEIMKAFAKASFNISTTQLLLIQELYINTPYIMFIYVYHIVSILLVICIS